MAGTSPAMTIEALARCGCLLREVVAVHPRDGRGGRSWRLCGLEVVRARSFAGLEPRAGVERPFRGFAGFGVTQERGYGLDRRRLAARLVLLADCLDGAGVEQLRPHLPEQAV